eukprot:COSAG04_NODE_326_length_16774_cov_39.129115_13_plen_219_part_00
MGHTQVWGSFCKVVDGEVVWGYACCGGKHHDSPQNQNWAAFSKDSKYEARILGAFSEDSSGVILRAGTTRYLGASAACQKNASQFLLEAGGEGGKKPSAGRSTGKRTGSGPSPRALMPPPRSEGRGTTGGRRRSGGRGGRGGGGGCGCGTDGGRRQVRTTLLADDLSRWAASLTPRPVAVAVARRRSRGANPSRSATPRSRTRLPPRPRSAARARSDG